MEPKCLTNLPATRVIENPVDLHKWTTEEGQRELARLCEKRDEGKPTRGLSALTYANRAISEVSESQWIQLDLTADSGAVDSVMPKSGLFEHLKIFP